MKIGGKALLFVSSYLPVWLVWICYSIYTYGLNLTVMLSSGIVLTILSFVTGFLFRNTYQTASAKHIKTIYISEISYGSSEAISYLLTLIIPIGASTLQMFGGTLDSNGIVTLILFLAIFLIYLRSNLVIMNPTMLLFGYSLYVISYKINKESEITFSAALIARKQIDQQDIKPMNTLTVVDQGIYLLSGD